MAFDVATSRSVEVLASAEFERNELDVVEHRHRLVVFLPATVGRIEAVVEMRLSGFPERKVSAERTSVRLSFEVCVEVWKLQNGCSGEVDVCRMRDGYVVLNLAVVWALLLVDFCEDLACDKKISLHNNSMTLLAICVILLLFLLATNLDISRAENLVHASAKGWNSVDSLIDGNEYNRNEHNINHAGDCRKKCSGGRCKAVRFEHDYLNSGRNICRFFDAFSGSIQSHKMPTNQTTSTWIRSA